MFKGVKDVKVWRIYTEVSVWSAAVYSANTENIQKVQPTMLLGFLLLGTDFNLTLIIVLQSHIMLK